MSDVDAGGEEFRVGGVGVEARVVVGEGLDGGVLEVFGLGGEVVRVLVHGVSGKFGNGVKKGSTLAGGNSCWTASDSGAFSVIVTVASLEARTGTGTSASVAAGVSSAWGAMVEARCVCVCCKV